MIVWRRMKAHSLLVERPRLGEDRVGHGDLADVVQLGGVADLLDLVVAELQQQRGRLGEVGDAAEVAAQVRVALGQRAQQHVLALAARGRAAGVLLRVHALVGDPQRLGDVRRLERAARSRRRSSRSRSPRRARRARRRRRRRAARATRRPGRSSAQNSSPPMRKAEPRPRRKPARLAPSRDQQRVAGRVAEGVVVVLEAVEVEEHEHERLGGRSRAAARARARARARAGCRAR